MKALEILNNRLKTIRGVLLLESIVRYRLNEIIVRDRLLEIKESKL